MFSFSFSDLCVCVFLLVAQTKVEPAAKEDKKDFFLYKKKTAYEISYTYTCIMFNIYVYMDMCIYIYNSLEFNKKSNAISEIYIISTFDKHIALPICLIGFRIPFFFYSYSSLHV